MNKSYAFDSFQDDQKKSEIDRLTNNVDSHSKALCEHFLGNGLITSSKVLDVGCGTGAMMNMFAEMMPDIEFVGIDNSNDILESADRVRKPNVRYIKGEATKLPFADDSFDFVYTRLVLMHNEYPLEIVQEMRRVCKPGGVMISVEIDDGTMVFHPYSQEFSHLIRANIEHSRLNGTDRMMGRKLYSLYKTAGIRDTKVITQTTDYEGPYDDVPFSFRLAMGSEECRHLVEVGFITEEQRRDYVHKIEAFCNDPDRFYSGSFMYCIGKKS